MSSFDEIPHEPLMKSVARRITDRQILHLIKVWIEAPVEETDDRGRKHRTTRNRDQHRGIPQGSPISPLLSNLYMRRLVLWWKQSGTRQRLIAVIVNYADDLVICCKGTADLAMQTMREVIEKLQLEVNEDKPASAVYRKKASTSWVIRSGGVTPARPGRPISTRGHRRRASSESAMRSGRRPASTRRRYQPRSC